MPEQQSRAGQPVTAAPFTQPFQTEIYPFGLGGLNLKDQLDKIPVGEFARHTNIIHTMDRAAEVRAGLTSLASVGTNHHSVRRLSDPQAATYTRVWGVDQTLYLGQSGALASIDTGYSGDPLVLLPTRPPLSGEPWLFVGDRTRNRKVRGDGLVLPIGLPKPATAPLTALGTRNLTSIANFTGDTDPSLWTPNTGFTFDNPPVVTDLPEILDVTAPDADDTNAINFGRIASSARPTGDYVFFGVPCIRDLSLVGAVPASDDDYIHLWVNVSHPLLITEFRIYLVCSGSFSPSVVPGVPDGLGNNTDAYVKAFSGNDFAGYISGEVTAVDAAEQARIHDIRNDNLIDESTGFPIASDDRPGWLNRRAATDSSRSITIAAPSGADQWWEYGVLGVPIRRGDFQRLGQTAGRDWATITGIICYLRTGPNSGPGPVAVRLGNMYLHGGASPDTGEPGMQSYDYRSTDYDPRTGAESNPGPDSTVTAPSNIQDPLRRQVIVTPPAASDSTLRQRIYRRGGSNIADWNFLGVNTSNGGAFTDTFSDDNASGAPTLDLDHFQPVPTVDDAGATVLAQPVPMFFGPANGMIFALGDPYRPGHLYWCTPDQPDHWGANNNFEVCSPSEELMAGGMHGAQPFCFSRERLYLIYPSLSDAVDVTVSTSGCKRGIVSRHGWTVGLGGIFGVGRDGIFVTAGGAETMISEQIERLFRGQTWNDYAPIDFTIHNAIRLSISEDRLFFLYQDTGGTRRVLVYPLVTKFWTGYVFTPDISYVLPDEDTAITKTLIGGKTTGLSYTHEGFSDNGHAIDFVLRTGDWDLGRPREDKLLGDQILDANLAGETVTWQNRLNNGTVENTVQSIDAGSSRQRYTFDSFGTVPQRTRNLSIELLGSVTTGRPVFYFLGQSFIPEPDQTLNRVTQWDSLGHPDEKWLTGVTFDCDTGGVDRTIIIERDFAGATSTVATLTVNTSGRHKLSFSWSGVDLHKVRVRPNDDCEAWILYNADWIYQPEPPRIARWDTFFEAAGDQYYTGLDLYCDTSGAEKQIQVEVDGAILTNPYTSEAFWRITANGRRYLHLTFLAGRGHVFRFTALDNNPGLLYSHKWWLDPEPTEQSNFLANYSTQGILADKWIKAVLFEVDTFGQNKTVTVELDGVVVDTLGVNTNGRKVVQLALSQQRLGRVLRVYPTDGNPGRAYSVIPIFDVEPYQLPRWQVQETDHGLSGFHSLIDAQVTLKSTADVVLTISTYVNQLGTILTDTYTIPSTSGVKDKRYVGFLARKGVLYGYLLTSSAAFHLYQEESCVHVQPWGSDQLLEVHPFGDDNVDNPTRSMITSSLAAARSGGGT